MRHGSLGGDWIEFTYDQFNEVCRVIEQIDYLEVIRYLREPAIRILNLQVMENSKGEIIHYEIISSQDVDANFTGGAVFENGLKTSCFMVDGSSAYEVFQCIQWFNENNEVCGYTWQTEYGSELTRKYVEDSELHFLAAFLAIQHLMLHCKELLSYRVEECIIHLAGKRRRGKKREYRHPEKVRIYTISKAGPLEPKNGKKCKQAHIWHCDAWGVRGHYRYLKAGKVSYVKPYVQGRKKDAYSGREYVLFKEDKEI